MNYPNVIFFTNFNKEPISNWIETNDFIEGKSVKLDGDKLRGNAFYFEVYRNTENWKSFFSFSNISPNYQSDVGFMVKNNRRWTTFFQSYQNYLNKAASKLANNAEEEFIHNDIGKNYNLSSKDKENISKPFPFLKFCFLYFL